MKTREIRDYIASMGFERGTVHVLESLNEAINQNARDMKELAHMFDKMVDSMDGMMTVAGAMKDKLAHMQQKEDGLDGNTNALDKT